MARWQAMVEANNPHGRNFAFEPPATPEQLAAAEALLGFAIPAEVKELLAEFNGVWDRTNTQYPEITFLDLDHMSVQVLNYFAGCRDPRTGNPLPPDEELAKVLFLYQSNGFGDLWGICVEDTGDHRAGEIVRLDHEEGELTASHPSLEEFVRSGPW